MFREQVPTSQWGTWAGTPHSQCLSGGGHPEGCVDPRQPQPLRVKGQLQQKVRFRKWNLILVRLPPLLLGYISGVSLVTRLGQEGPLGPVKFRRGSLVPPSTPTLDSSHSGSGCQDLPRA